MTLSQNSIVPVRNRSEVTAPNLKKPEMIPPSEVRQAIFYFVKEHVGLRREELPAMVSSVLGFKTTSPKLKELVDKTLTSALKTGDVVSRDDNSSLPSHAHRLLRDGVTAVLVSESPPTTCLKDCTRPEDCTRTEPAILGDYAIFGPRAITCATPAVTA